MRANEIVVALEQRYVGVKILLALGMACGSTTQIRTAHAYREVMPLDKGGVYDLGVLGVE